MADLSSLTDPDLELRFKTQYAKKQQIDLEAGQTLCEIWKRGTWKRKFTDFGVYVNDVLSISKPTAYQLIGTVDKSVGQYEKKEPVLKQVKSVKPLNTSCDSEPKTQETEFSMPDSKPEPEEKQPEIVIYKDREGRQIDGEMAELFIRCDDQVKRWDSIIRDLKATILGDIKDDPVWGAFNESHFEQHIKNIKAQIKFARPWAQCPVCGGDGGVKGGCKTCKDPTPIDKDNPKPKKGRGWLIHQQWRCIPEDDK